MPTNGFSIKPLRVKLLAGEQKAFEILLCQTPAPASNGSVHLRTQSHPGQSGCIQRPSRAPSKREMPCGEKGVHWLNGRHVDQWEIAKLCTQAEALYIYVYICGYGSSLQTHSRLSYKMCSLSASSRREDSKCGSPLFGNTPL